MVAIAWLLVALGTGLVGLGAVALFKLRSAGNTEVQLLGMKVTTPAPGLAVIVIGIAAILLGARTLPVPKLTVVDVSLTTAGTGRSTADYGRIRCPVAVGLVGQISVSAGGTVAYRFDKAQGIDGPTQHGPVQLATFAAPGTETIRHEEDVNLPFGTARFREFLTILSPGTRQSSPVSVTVKCDPAAPPPPSGPPPSTGTSPP
jgi:hypothetical protein